MTAIETNMILQILCGAYPDRAQAFKTEVTLDIWSRALQDLPFDDVSSAVTAWILTEHWPPSIADIRAKSYNLRTEPDALASHAWDELLRALRQAYAPESRDVWDRLPDITKLVVGGYVTFKAWGNTDTASLQSVQRPMFVKRFEEYQRRKRKEAAIPESYREPLPSLPTTPEKPKIEECECERSLDKTVQAPKDKLERLRVLLSNLQA